MTDSFVTILMLVSYGTNLGRSSIEQNGAGRDPAYFFDFSP
jgi:hypothetical protein